MPKVTVTDINSKAYGTWSIGTDTDQSLIADPIKIDSNGVISFAAPNSTTYDTVIERASGGGISVTGGITPTGPIHLTTSTPNPSLEIDNSTVVTAGGDILLKEASAASNALGILVNGDSHNRLLIDANGDISWGGGTLARDVFLERILAAVLGVSGSLEVGSLTDLGDGGAGVLKLADATTLPTANPTAGVVISSQSDAATPLQARLPSGQIKGLVDTFAITTGTVTTTSASQSAVSGLLLPVEANATYEMYSGQIVSISLGADAYVPSWTGPSGATMQWNRTGTTTDYQSTISGTGINLTGVTGTLMVFYAGLLVTSATPGNLQATFASTSGGTATNFAGSWLRLKRLA